MHLLAWKAGRWVEERHSEYECVLFISLAEHKLVIKEI
jgi:hypothetical protein